MKTSGIYKIQSLIKPERCYVGSAVDIKKRWNGHLHDLRNYKHHSIKLQNHYNKYGEKDLIFSILELHDSVNLLIREQYFIDTCNPFFNILPTAGNHLGAKRSIESCKKISEAKKGNKNYMFGRTQSKEMRDKVSLSLKGNKHALGHNHSEETKRKISIASTGRSHIVIEITKNKISTANTGKPSSMKGKHHTEETKRRLSELNIGRKHTIETKIKISQGLIGIKRSPHSEISKQKHSLCIREAWKSGKYSLRQTANENT